MQRTSLLLMVVGGILSACIAYDSSRGRIGEEAGAHGGAGMLRHAAGSFCPPRLAMKGHC